MLNNNSIYLDDFLFYENVINVFNVSDLLVDKKTHTYSIEKNVAVLLIDRIIPDSHPNVFQLSVSIQNLKNDSYMEIEITDVRINNNFQFESRYTWRGINNNGELIENLNINKNILEQWEKSGPIGKKEATKFASYTLESFPEFKENSIRTIRYNPQKATVEYWYDNNKINFISEIYVIRPYFSKFFIKIYNCSVRFISIINVPQSKNLNKRIPLKVFPIQDEVKILDINNYNDSLEKDNDFLNDSEIKIVEVSDDKDENNNMNIYGLNNNISEDEDFGEGTNINNNNNNYNNNNDFLSNFINITSEDNNIYQFTNYESNNNKNNDNNKIKNKIIN
jgi:hypothetical protein